MLLTELTYENLDEFNKDHSSTYTGEFFVHQTQEQLQKIVDQTLDSLRHKREFVGDDDLCKAARALLKNAASTEKTAQVRVRWGMHQKEDDYARGRNAVDNEALTSLHHFTVTTLITGENDWHLYTDKQMHTIMYMSRSRTESVKIDNV